MRNDKHHWTNKHDRKNNEPLTARVSLRAQHEQ